MTERKFLATLCLLLFCVQYAESSSTSKGNNFAILRGETIRIPCIPKNIQVEGESDIGSSFTWNGENGEEVIDARFTKLASGELEINNAHVADSGVYTCKFRPPVSWGTKQEEGKLFKHKLMVYETAGLKYETSVFFDLSQHSAENTASGLEELLKSTVCSKAPCIPGKTKSKKCALLETGKQTCEFSITYEAIEPIPDQACDEDCVRDVMNQRLMKAEELLKMSLAAQSGDPRSFLQPDMTTYETVHRITCRAGFHLIKTRQKRCFPCSPGSYSKRNSLKCRMCAVGFYQEHYGRNSCEKCEESKTTDSVGARSSDECVSTNTGILNNIKEGIVSIFNG